VAGRNAGVYLPAVPLLPVYGHVALKAQLRAAVDRGALPGSLLLHGPRGIGKQQVALWLARLLLCQNTDRAIAPCGTCQACRMSTELRHPDLHWFFPRPRLKDSDADAADIREDIAEGIASRLESHGVYEAASGDEAIFVATVRTIVQTGVLAPAMGNRKLFVIGDAERMVAQEGADQAANAFLKMLEEPPANTNIILTSSEPGALLPTIKSRVASVRVAPLSDVEVRAFLDDPTVKGQLDIPKARVEEFVALAGGAPGRLIGREAWEAALNQARALIDAASSPDRGARMRAALGQGAAGARGKFSDTLDALTVLLYERSRHAAKSQDNTRALGAARAIDAVEEAKELASSNVNPQLLTASLLKQLAPLLR
jgi:DNA polymerase-3 subunit delta'